ncbi:MAG: 16S rRNA (uracil(1498)-N(3))-methyltransferase [Ornithinibacter sp.]
MSLPVHHVPSVSGRSVGDEVEVTGDEAHHAVAVRRLRVGESVVLTDGVGTRATGVVTETGKRVFSVSLSAVDLIERPTPALVVVQALPKGDRGELAVEVLTEIGAELIVPWAAERSVAVWKGERAVKSHARWVATAREAAKQARRDWFPEVAPLATTAQVIELVRQADQAVALHEGATAPLPAPTGDLIVLIVGPEGGLGDEEVAAFSTAGAVIARLGTEVLRTSTAGVAAASALLAQTPRWA